MDVLLHIKRLVVARQVEFKAREHLYVIESPNYSGRGSTRRERSAAKAARRCSMSSSRRRSPRSPAGRCPTCGSRRVVTAHEAIVLRVKRRNYTIDGVQHERCLSCGEHVFGYAASRRIDDVVLRRGRERAA